MHSEKRHTLDELLGHEGRSQGRRATKLHAGNRTYVLPSMIVKDYAQKPSHSVHQPMYSQRMTSVPRRHATFGGFLGKAFLALTATTISAVPIYQRAKYSPPLLSQTRPPIVQVQEEHEPYLVDLVKEAPLDSLDIPLASKNMKRLIQAWKPLFEKSEETWRKGDIQMPLSLRNALIMHETGLEEKTEIGISCKLGERVIRSSTGARGPFQVTGILIEHYNNHHPGENVRPHDMDRYEKNMKVFDWQFKGFLEKRRGHYFLALMDHVSGPGTTNYILGRYVGNKKTNAIDAMIASLWKDTIPPRPHEDPKKSITQAMIRQAKNLPYHVSVLTYLNDLLEQASGRNPQEGLSPLQGERYRAFLALGKTMYNRAYQESLKEIDGNPATRANPRLAQFYNDRLVRETVRVSSLQDLAENVALVSSPARDVHEK